MKMEFTYQDFLDNYLYSATLVPERWLTPITFLDQRKFGQVLADKKVEKRIRTTFNELEARLGKNYFLQFEPVQTRAKEYGYQVFPAYKMLFLDIACEDWLSLVDFHKGFSRDHSVHQPLTAYIVCKLLGGGEPTAAFQINGESLLDKALDVIINGQETLFLRDRLKFYNSTSKLLSGDRTLWKQVFYHTAISTAMYHDLGYPWQFIERMHDFLMDDNLLCGRLSKENPLIDDYIKMHNEELMFRPFYNYGKGGKTTADIDNSLFEHFLHNSHGLPGALAYYAYNKEYRSNAKTKESELVKFCQEWSCLAILMHDMQKAYAMEGSGFPRLNFKDDPLSFIIALADTLEDFNRPNVDIKQTDEGCKIKYSFPTLSVELEENNGVAEMRYQVNPADKANQAKFKEDDQQKLFDKTNGYFDLSSIGLSELTIGVK